MTILTAEKSRRTPRYAWWESGGRGTRRGHWTSVSKKNSLSREKKSSLKRVTQRGGRRRRLWGGGWVGGGGGGGGDRSSSGGKAGKASLGTLFRSQK